MIHLSSAIQHVCTHSFTFVFNHSRPGIHHTYSSRFTLACEAVSLSPCGVPMSVDALAPVMPSMPVELEALVQLIDTRAHNHHAIGMSSIRQYAGNMRAQRKLALRYPAERGTDCSSPRGRRASER